MRTLMAILRDLEVNLRARRGPDGVFKGGYVPRIAELLDELTETRAAHDRAKGLKPRPAPEVIIMEVQAPHRLSAGWLAGEAPTSVKWRKKSRNMNATCLCAHHRDDHLPYDKVKGRDGGCLDDDCDCVEFRNRNALSHRTPEGRMAGSSEPLRAIGFGEHVGPSLRLFRGGG